jgi:hypothetical protein
MLRFVPPRQQRLSHTPSWPEAKPPKRRTAFSRRPALEVLSVVIDASLMEDHTVGVNLTRRHLLQGLLTHDLVSLLRYSDSGPPADVQHAPDPYPAAASGWLVVGDFDPIMNDWPVTAYDGETITETGFGGDLPTFAERDADDRSYARLDAEEASAKRRADVVAAQAAKAIDADLFITTRPYLHSAAWIIVDGLVIATPEQALPLVGLYLRAQGEFVVWRNVDGRGSWTRNRGLFYARGAFELVPHGWTTLTALAYEAQSGGGDRVAAQLARTLFWRLEQTLVARDNMYWALNMPQDNDVADEALSAFDIAVLMLMGAVDASARIVHRLLNLEREKPAAWQDKDWRKLVRSVSPLLGKVAGTSTHQESLRILRGLRNTIHGPRLDPLAVAGELKHERTAVQLPADEQERMLVAMKNLGGLARFGVERFGGDRYHADPAKLLDAILARITKMLDVVLEEIPVPKFPTAHQGVITPQQQFAHAAFGDVPGESVLWQLDL